MSCRSCLLAAGFIWQTYAWDRVFQRAQNSHEACTNIGHRQAGAIHTMASHCFCTPTGNGEAGRDPTARTADDAPPHSPHQMSLRPPNPATDAWHDGNCAWMSHCPQGQRAGDRGVGIHHRSVPVAHPNKAAAAMAQTPAVHARCHACAITTQQCGFGPYVRGTPAAANDVSAGASV